jgi:predicted nucleic acid-binding Zn ribbon protein
VGGGEMERRRWSRGDEMREKWEENGRKALEKMRILFFFFVFIIIVVVVVIAIAMFDSRNGLPTM